MSKEPVFYSSWGDAFWDNLGPGEQSALQETMVAECKKVIRTYLIFLLIMVLACIFGVMSIMRDGISYDPRVTFIVFGSIIVIPMFVDAVIRIVRYKKKAEELRFRSAHVKIVDKTRSMGFSSPKCIVTVASTDETKNALATIQVENPLYEKLGIGLTGRYTLIDDENKSILTSPSWFMSDTDPKYRHIPTVSRPISTDHSETKPDVVVSGEASSDVSRESIVSEFLKGHRMDFVLSGIATGMFLIAFLIALIGAVLTPEFSKDTVRLVMLPFVFFACAGCAFMTPVYNRVIYTKKKIYLLFWALMLNVNVFGMPFVVMLSVPGRILASVVVLALDLLFVYLANKDKIDIYKEIKAGRYRAVSAFVMSKDMRTRYIYPIFIVRLCTCVVETDSGASYEINITPAQHKQFYSGMTGSMIILDNMGTDYLFVRA